MQHQVRDISNVNSHTTRYCHRLRLLVTLVLRFSGIRGFANLSDRPKNMSLGPFNTRRNKNCSTNRADLRATPHGFQGVEGDEARSSQHRVSPEKRKTRKKLKHCFGRRWRSAIRGESWNPTPHRKLVMNVLPCLTPETFRNNCAK